MKHFFLVYALLFSLLVCAEPKSSEIQSELRGAWVATVVNIDWPKSPDKDDNFKRIEIDSIISRFRDLGINAIFLQVRPSYGTLYPSEIEPWSRFYSKDTSTINFDPLAYWIDQCHENGIELHAWINPYRTLFSPSKDKVDKFLKEQSNPEWYIMYGKNLYMDPGRPETRDHVLSIIKEIVSNYDVDGIHFDDYFYPYKEAGKEYNDDASYAIYGEDFSNRGDWRRNNVDLLIESIHNYLVQAAPLVKFGVSPFGVWRNKKDDPKGSDTNAGVTSYDDLYADVLYWSQQKWIDYIAPQIYWPIGYNIADYKILAQWWNDNVPFGDIYIGQATYKFSATSKQKQWKNANELKKQVELNRELPKIKGNIFYNTTSVMGNTLNVMDLTKKLYAQNAIIPTMSWKSIPDKEYPIYEDEVLCFIGPNHNNHVYTPILATPIYKENEGVYLKWVIERDPRSFIITRERVNRNGKRKGKEEVIAIPGGGEMSFLDNGVKKNKFYKYRMVAVGKNSIYSSISTPRIPITQAK